MVNHAISGVVTVRETGQPLRGLIITAGRLLPEGEELLGWTVSGDGGRFCIEYSRLLEPSDLFLHLYGPDGRLLFMEPPHRAIGGAELSLHLEIPLAAFRSVVH